MLMYFSYIILFVRFFVLRYVMPRKPSQKVDLAKKAK